MKFTSWGNYPKNLNSCYILSKDELPILNLPFLPYGKGRSYGDVCLTRHGCYILTSNKNFILDLDPQNLLLRVEAGVTLKTILELITKHNLFLPVVPGTQHVTVGGAIANDIHGKSHHLHGSFGNNVLSLKLTTSSGTKELCENSQEFRATIGGLGLTGLIQEAVIKLIRIPGTTISQINKVTLTVEETVSVLEELSSSYTYTVSWLDLLSQKFRAIVMGGNFTDSNTGYKKTEKPALSYPFFFKIINNVTLKILNEIYFLLNQRKHTEFLVDYKKFFFPLDIIDNWNRAYGIDGFIQWQSVLPKDAKLLKECIGIIKKSECVPCLCVLKDFGSIQPKGLLSFPQAGYTLAVDFPVSYDTFKLVEELNKFVADAHGKIYLAKDALLKKKEFLKMYPEVNDFVKYKDRNFCSDLWRRLVE
ncbi:MAG: FAD-binding oxidoreductase [Deltaproteobacteria bacterium]|nr:FAD-binding oxidoreductase [Deltaproteobacteria bacterium]